MNKFKLLLTLLLLCASVSMSWAQITLSNTKVYAIKNKANPDMYLVTKTGDANNYLWSNTAAGITYSADDRNCQWMVYNTGGDNYVLYSVGKGGVANDSQGRNGQDNHWTVVTDLDNPSYMEVTSHNNGEYFSFRDKDWATDANSFRDKAYMHYSNNNAYSKNITDWSIGCSAPASAWVLVELYDIPEEYAVTLKKVNEYHNAVKNFNLNYVLDGTTETFSTQIIPIALAGDRVSTLATEVPGGQHVYRSEPYAVVAGTTDYTIYYGPDIYVPTDNHTTLSTHSGRYTANIKLQTARGEQTISTGQSTIGKKIWQDQSTQHFKCAKGESITPTVGFTGTWMHSYCYIDEDNNGFKVNEATDIVDHALRTGTDCDLKSFTFYSGYMSDGTAKTFDQAANIKTMPAFTAPQTPGTYRMRYMVQWNHTDPNGNPSISSNGGLICDVSLDVFEEYTVTVNHVVNGEQTRQDTFKLLADGVENVGYTPTTLPEYTGIAGVIITNAEARDITDNTEITITYTPDYSALPFVPATVDADGNLTSGNYYMLTLNGKNTYYDPSTGCDKDRWMCNGEEWKGDARDYFFFVGNVFDGFSIHSAIEGGNTGFNVTTRHFESTLTKYNLINNGGNYGFKVVGTTKGINDADGNGTVGVWNSANFDNAQCHFTFTVANTDDVNTQVQAYKDNITSLQPDPNKRYYIVSALSGFESHADGDHKEKTVYLDGTTLKWKSIDKLDKRAMWTWTATEGGYTVKNVANPDAEVHCTSSSDTHSSNPIRLWWLSDNQFNIQDADSHVWHAEDHHSGAYLTGNVITYGGEASSPSAWRLVEVSEDLWEAACAKETLQSLVASAEIALLTDDYTIPTNLITSADQLASNAGQNEIGNKIDGGGIPALLDDTETFFHSLWSGTDTPQAHHFLQIDFGENAPYYVQFQWWKRPGTNGDNNRPKTVEVWGTNTAELAALAEGKQYTTVDYNQTTWNEGWNIVTTLNIDTSTDPVVNNTVSLGGYRYIRLNVTATNTNTKFFTMSKIAAFAQNAALINAINAANEVLNGDSEDAAYYETGITAIKSVLAAPLRSALATVIDGIEANMETVGPNLGQYNIVGITDAASQLAAARILAASGTDVDELQAMITELQSWTFSLNMPQAGQFIRIQGVSNKWITAEPKNINGLNQMAMGTDKESANTIFYVTESGTTNSGQGTAKLLSYGKGVYVVSTFGLGAVGAEGYEFAFGDSKVENNYGTLGQYNIRVEQNNNTRTAYLYDSGNNNNRVSTDRNGDPHNNTAWTLEEVTSLPVTIGDAKYATLNLPVAVTIPNDVSAWYSYWKENEPGVVVLHKIKADGNGYKILHANTPVVLHAEPDTYNFNITTGGTTPENTAALQGTTAAEAVTANSVYVLGIDNNNANRIGFFNYTGTTLGGFKAYIPKTAGASNIRVSWDDVETAIEAIENDDLQTGVMYNLNGQRVMKGHGFVIVNGKKMIIK